jgi:hypothetical protein
MLKTSGNLGSSSSSFKYLKNRNLIQLSEDHFSEKIKSGVQKGLFRNLSRDLVRKAAPSRDRQSSLNQSLGSKNETLDDPFEKFDHPSAAQNQVNESQMMDEILEDESQKDATRAKTAS